MRVDLNRRKLLFKAKTQPVNNSSSQGKDEWHSMEVDGLMHSIKAKIDDLIKEHLQTKEKTRMVGGGWVGAGGRKEKEEEEGADLISVF
jgi:hypothetical protein